MFSETDSIIFRTKTVKGSEHYSKQKEGVVKKMIVLILTIFVLTAPLMAQEGFKGRPITNNLWSPTAHTLHKNEFAIGIGPVAVGLSENVQVSTNLFLWLFQIYNANMKVSLVKSGNMSVAAGLQYQRFDLASLFEDGDVAFNSISPFLAFTTSIGQSTDLHIAGKYSYFSSDSDIEDVEAEGSASGTEIMGGIEHSMSHKTKLLADIGYDITFEGFRAGVGVLFGWEKFRLKLGVGYFDPKNAENAFTLPVIGLWWRFNG